MLTDIETWLETTGMKVAEVCFINTPPPLPYINFIDNSETSGPDDLNCIADREISIELYSSKIDKVSEGKIEVLLNEKAIKYSKEHVWITTTKIMSTIYGFSLTEKF